MCFLRPRWRLGTSKSRHDRGKRFHRVVRNNDIAETPSLSTFDEPFTQFVRGANEKHGQIERIIPGKAEHFRRPQGSTPSVDDHRGNGSNLYLQRRESIACCIAYPTKAAIVVIECRLTGYVIPLLARRETRVDPYGVSLLRRQRKYSPTASANDDRR